MKNIAIIILVLGIAFSYSCKKEGKSVQTTITGTLLTNGTNDKINISIEIDRPYVKLYEQTDGPGIYANGYKEIASVTVDENARYSFDLKLNERNVYFVGYRNLDTTIYFPSPYSWAFHDETYRFNYISVGASNNINLPCLAKSWVRPRFINTNPDPNNKDVFVYRGGLPCDNCGSSGLPPIFYGSVDSTLYWVGRTWSGTYRNGIVNYDMAHKVKGKLTRNGVTRDTSIIYTVPPFDTTVVEIRY